MSKELLSYEKAFKANGESPERALILAHDRCIIDEFRKLHSELLSVRKLLLANYGENALKQMNDNE